MKQLSVLLGLCLICFASCTKSLTDAADSSSLAEADKVAPLSSSGVVDATSEWYGRYLYYKAPDPDDPGDPDGALGTITDDELILGGTAKVRLADTSLLIYTTSIVYDIPYSRNFGGDSIVFEGTIRNNVNTASMYIAGYQNSAQVIFQTPQDNAMNCYVNVGRSGKSFTIKPAIDFTSYKVVQFAIKGNKAILIVNNKQLTSFPISTADRLGGITQLSLGTDGYVECDC